MPRLRELLKNRRVVIATVAAGALLSSAAFGLPWSLDMVDSQAYKAYKRPMAPLPEGVVAQPNILSPKGALSPNYAFGAPEIDRLSAPFEPTEDRLALGARMYDIYCQTCHGDGVELGPLSERGFPAVPRLYGPGGMMNVRSDGWVYMVIRNGGPAQIMPAYGYTMSEEEMWAMVLFMHQEHTARGGTRPQPAPEPEPAEDAEGGEADDPEAAPAPEESE